MKKLNYLLISLTLIFVGLGITSCERKGKDLLSLIPQETDCILHLKGADILQKANLKQFETIVGKEEMEKSLKSFEKVTNSVDINSVLFFADLEEGRENLMALAPVKDTESLIELAKKEGLTIEEEEGYQIFSADGLTFFVNENYIWISFERTVKSAAETIVFRSEKREFSAKDIKGIDKIFKGDIGAYINPSAIVSLNDEIKKAFEKQMEMTAGLGNAKIEDLRYFYNMSFEKKDIAMDVEVFTKDGEPYILENCTYPTLDKALLAYLPKGSDMVAALAFDGVMVNKMLTYIQRYIGSKLGGSLSFMENFDGTLLAGVKAGTGIMMSQKPEFVGVFAQVKEGTAEQTLESIIALPTVKGFEKVGEEYVFSMDNQGNSLYLGAKEDFIYASMSPFQEFEASMKDDEIVSKMSDYNSCFFIDMRKESTIASFLPMIISYPLDGYIAMEGTKNTGHMVFHNEAAEGDNILEGLLKLAITSMR